MYECKNRKLFDDNCSNGNVLMSNRRCDGYIECSDGSDEGEHCLGEYGCCKTNLNATFHGLEWNYEYAGFDTTYNRPYYVANPIPTAKYVLFFGYWVGHRKFCGKAKVGFLNDICSQRIRERGQNTF